MPKNWRTNIINKNFRINRNVKISKEIFLPESFKNPYLRTVKSITYQSNLITIRLTYQNLIQEGGLC